MAGRLFSYRHGRYLAGAAVVIPTLVAGGAYSFINGVFSQWQVNRVAFISGGIRKELPEELRARANEVINMAKIAKKKKVRYLRLFLTHDSVVRVGSLEILHGLQLGLPWTFTYKTTDDINPQIVHALSQGQQLDWHSELGKKLLDSLVFSPEAQKFAIARELYFANSYNFFFKMIWLMGIPGLTKGINDEITNYLKFSELKHPLHVRLRVYLTAAAIGTVAFFKIWFRTNLYHDEKADEQAAGHGDEFLEGGIEYYSKMLSRNQCLRELMGPSEGPRHYTEVGDEASIIKLEPSISDKLAFLHKLKEKRKDKNYKTEKLYDEDGQDEND